MIVSGLTITDDCTHALPPTVHKKKIKNLELDGGSTNYL